MPIPDFKPTDPCARCGLRRATRALEEKGIALRLCDDCYWGREDVVESQGQPAAPARNPAAPSLTSGGDRRHRAVAIAAAAEVAAGGLRVALATAYRAPASRWEAAKNRMDTRWQVIGSVCMLLRRRGAGPKA